MIFFEVFVKIRTAMETQPIETTRIITTLTTGVIMGTAMKNNRVFETVYREDGKTL